MSEIVHLANTKLTPEVLLHRALSHLKNTKAVVVLSQSNDGDWDVLWSHMSVGDLCTAEKWLSLEVADVMMGLAE
jgi:hypothetical protein